MLKTKEQKPIKTSVFLPQEVHAAAQKRADRRKLSTSRWIAQLVAKTVNVELDNGNAPSYY